MTEQKLKVDVTGKGEETVTVQKETTLSELRSMLALSDDVVAYDKDGKELGITDKVFGLQEVDFVPDVTGGAF